ncbi:Type IV pilus biogenesis protein PilQ [hydrothermal vent metagenome]|uniref:Type IV pilus biogenesis protein PilQ n=1 Tax=hydrothermal vent metagenome TaxID=652676 RepID=A0A3B1A7H2_9ZZZZ
MKIEMDWESWKMKTQSLSRLKWRMKNLLRQTHLGTVFVSLLMAFSLPVYALDGADANEPIQVLEDVGFISLPGDRVQIRLSITGMTEVAQPLSFTIDNPARIALDFPGITSNIAKKTPIGMGVARSINAVEAKGRTRVVLNLVRMVPYETRVDGSDFYIILGSDAMKETVATLSDDGEVVHEVVEKSHEIKNIDFRRGKNGEAHIIVTLSDPTTPVNITEESGNIVLDFLDARLPEEFVRRLDVIDFATPVTTIDSFMEKRNARLVVRAEGDYVQLAYQANETFTLEIAPLTEEEKAVKKDKFGYSGERLSLNFQDIEIRAVLQLIADFTDINMVTSDTVQGSVTLRLQNVPWDQALDLILKTKGLAKRKQGNVMLIAPSEEIAAREKQEFESLKQVDELAPLFSEVIQINYAKAADIAGIISSSDNSMMSDRGRVSVDERTNNLLIRDTLEKLEEILRLIDDLDIAVRQVLIESRIVIANDDFKRDVGARFGASGVKNQSGGNQEITSGSLNGTTQIGNGSTWQFNDRMNVNLPVIGDAGSLGLAVLGSNFLIEMELSAMQAEGKGEVVSSPRVITSNQSTGIIEQGVEVPYQEASSSGATTTSFKKAVLSLEVTPQITPDDRIIMDLIVKKDNVIQNVNGGNIPSIETREVQTQVLVENGETVVLGGIYEQIKSDRVAKVPFFGDIPLIGVLFRRTTKEDFKDELLIFVTPKILKESLGAR